MRATSGMHLMHSFYHLKGDNSLNALEPVALNE